MFGIVVGSPVSTGLWNTYNKLQQSLDKQFEEVYLEIFVSFGVFNRVIHIVFIMILYKLYEFDVNQFVIFNFKRNSYET